MTKLVSIIVTAYNQADTISQTLDSIFLQEFDGSFEVIIGDDCSNDNTRSICLDYKSIYPDIIKVLFHNENLGVGANFALCTKLAVGKYIAICAADDFWHNKNKLQLQVEYLENNPDCGLLYTDYDKLNINNGRTIRNYIHSTNTTTYEGINLIQKIFSGKVPALTLTVMFRRELFEKYIPKNDYINLRFPLEDWPTWLILSKYTKFGYLPISTGTYRYGNDSISNPMSYEGIEEKFRKEKVMYKYLCDMFPNELNYDESEFVRYVNYVLLNFAYKRFDYHNGKNYAFLQMKLGNSSFKIRAAQHWISFYLYAFLKRIKNYFSY